jgi:WD40 repeat protein
MSFSIASVLDAVFLSLISIQTASAPQNANDTKAAQTPVPVRLDSSGDPLPAHAVARLGSTRLQHPEAVFTVHFAPDGKSLIASSGIERRGQKRSGEGIYIWEPRTGKLLRQMGGFIYGPGNIALSPDGKFLATESGAGVVGVLEIATGKILYQITWADKGNVIACSFSADGKTIALTGAGSGIQLWDSVTGEVIRRFGPDGGWAICYSPDGKSLASSGRRAIHLWDPETGKELWHFEMPQEGFFGPLRFSHNGKLVAVGGLKSGGVLILDAGSGKQVRQWQAHDAKVQSLAFSPDDSTLATGPGVGEIRLWDVASGRQIRELAGHRGSAYCLDFSPDGKLLASGGHDNRVRIWDVQTGKELLAPSGHQDMVDGVAYSPDGQFIASTGFDGTLLEWPWRSKQAAKRYQDSSEPLTSVAYSPNGRLLATASWDAQVRLYQPGVGLKQALKGHGNGQYIYAMAFDPTGKLLASASIDSSIRLWDVATFKEVRKLEGGAQGKWVRSLAFSPDGRILASGREDGSVQLADVESGKPLRTFAGREDFITSVAFRPDGKTLAIAEMDGSVRLLDVLTGRELVRYRGNRGEHRSIAFSPDGWFLATGEGDGQVLLWETLTGKKLLRLTGPDQEVMSVAFAPDGKTFASGSRDHSVLVWDATGLENPNASALANPSDTDLQKLWDELASSDSLTACRAMWRLRAAPRETGRFLGGKLTAAPGVEAESIDKWIKDLDDNQFAVRNKAAQELEKLQELALPALQEALVSSKSDEVRRRTQQLLAKFKEKPLTSESLRALRAVAVLEYTNIPEAEQVLSRLARGGAGARLTREAQAALQRMKKSRVFP